QARPVDDDAGAQARLLAGNPAEEAVDVPPLRHGDLYDAGPHPFYGPDHRLLVPGEPFLSHRSRLVRADWAHRSGKAESQRNTEGRAQQEGEAHGTQDHAVFCEKPHGPLPPSRLPAGSHLPAHRCCRKVVRSEEHTSELQSRENLVCRLLREKTKNVSPTAKTRSSARRSSAGRTP